MNDNDIPPFTVKSEMLLVDPKNRQSNEPAERVIKVTISMNDQNSDDNFTTDKSPQKNSTSSTSVQYNNNEKPAKPILKMSYTYSKESPLPQKNVRLPKAQKPVLVEQVTQSEERIDPEIDLKVSYQSPRTRQLRPPSFNSPIVQNFYSTVSFLSEDSDSDQNEKNFSQSSEKSTAPKMRFSRVTTNNNRKQKKEDLKPEIIRRKKDEDTNFLNTKRNSESTGFSRSSRKEKSDSVIIRKEKTESTPFYSTESEKIEVPIIFRNTKDQKKKKPLKNRPFFSTSQEPLDFDKIQVRIPTVNDDLPIFHEDTPIETKNMTNQFSNKDEQEIISFDQEEGNATLQGKREPTNYQNNEESINKTNSSTIILNEISSDICNSETIKHSSNAPKIEYQQIFTEKPLNNSKVSNKKEDFEIYFDTPSKTPKSTKTSNNSNKRSQFTFNSQIPVNIESTATPISIIKKPNRNDSIEISDINNSISKLDPEDEKVLHLSLDDIMNDDEDQGQKQASDSEKPEKKACDIPNPQPIQIPDFDENEQSQTVLMPSKGASIYFSPIQKANENDNQFSSMMKTENQKLEEQQKPNTEEIIETNIETKIETNIETKNETKTDTKDESVWMFIPAEKKKQQRKEVSITPNLSKVINISRSHVKTGEPFRSLSMLLTKNKFNHFVMTLNEGDKKLLGIYTLNDKMTQIHKIWGDGPEKADINDVKASFVYNPSSKKFNDQPNVQFNQEIDAVYLK